MEQISPTRMNLLQKRKQIKTAEQGAGLLRNKRDALLQEFMGLIKPILQDRKKLDNRISRSLSLLASALGVDGREVVESAAMALKRRYPLSIQSKKVWGVQLPEIETSTMVRSTITRGYSPVSVTSRIDVTAQSFEEVLETIVNMAPREIKLKRLGNEIKKTSRRVNALEQKLIPDLRGQVQFITQILEDREREDKFRLKRLKSKKVKFY